jgi:hypothetical protein
MPKEVDIIGLTSVSDTGEESQAYMKGLAQATDVYPFESGDLSLPGENKTTLDKVLENIRAYLENLDTLAKEKRSISDDTADNSSVNVASTKAVASVKALVDALNTDLASNSTEVIKRAPIDHSSEDKTYGGATASLYGHVKLSDGYVLGSSEQAAAADSIAASKKALATVYKTLNEAKAAVAHAATDTTYGAGSSTKYGHVKVSDTYKTAITNGDADNGVAASQKALYNAYNELSTNTETGIASKAPIMHASSADTYGVGTGSAYGHLKISDTYSGDDVAKTGAAANGIAASLYAVNRAAAAAQTNMEASLEEGHAKEHATSEKSSHVTLSDDYETGAGNADSGVGASSNAVADAYSSLSKSITTLQNSLAALNNQMVQESSVTTFEDDGSIVVTTATTKKTTTFLDDGNIDAVLEITNSDGSTTIVDQLTKFNDDGSIENVVTTEIKEAATEATSEES